MRRRSQSSLLRRESRQRTQARQQPDSPRSVHAKDSSFSLVLEGGIPAVGSIFSSQRRSCNRQGRFRAKRILSLTAINKIITGVRKNRDWRSKGRICPLFQRRGCESPRRTSIVIEKRRENAGVDSGNFVRTSENSPQPFRVLKIYRWERNQNHRFRPNDALAVADSFPGEKSGSAAGKKSVIAPNAVDGAESDRRPRCPRRAKSRTIVTAQKQWRTLHWCSPFHTAHHACRFTIGLAEGEIRKATSLSKTLPGYRSSPWRRFCMISLGDSHRGVS